MDNSIKSVLRAIFFYFTLFLLTLAFCLKSDVLDYDLFSRLIQGFGVIHNKSVYYHDILSYTPTHIWYDPEWLSSAFIYLICSKFKLMGLFALKVILIYLFLVILNICTEINYNMKDRTKSIAFYAFVLFLMQNIAITSHTVRCQLFTFILLAIWIILLEFIRKGFNKLLFLLPLIMLLWLNVHGGCIAGAGILFLYIVGEAINKKPFKKYIYVSLAILLVFFINPWGFDYLKFIFDSSIIDRSWILEWQSSLINPSFIFIASILLTIFCYFFRIFKDKIKLCNIDKTRATILFMLIYLSIMHIKHTGLFIAGAVIFMYEDYIYCFDYLMAKLKQYLQIDDSSIPLIVKIKNIILYLSIYLFIFINILLHPPLSACNKNTSEVFPIKAVEFLSENNIKGNIFAPFYYSAYIAYKCYPSLKIYMDGRQEQVYDYDLFDREMFFMINAGKNNIKLLDSYNHDLILIEKKYNLNERISNLPQWKIIYEDDLCAIYTKKDIARFKYNEISKSNNEIMDSVFDSYFK